MSDLLFAVPWWLFGSLVIVGGIIFWTGIKQQKKKNPMYVGIALILLAVGLKTLSYFVETDKEKCERQSVELVMSVEKHDWPKFISLLDDEVSLGTAEGTIFPNRDRLIEGAKKDTGIYDPKNVGTHIADSEQDATGITVDIDVSSESGNGLAMGMRVPTSWKMAWQKSGKDWRLHEIICTKIGTSGSKEMGNLIAK